MNKVDYKNMLDTLVKDNKKSLTDGSHFVPVVFKTGFDYINGTGGAVNVVTGWGFGTGSGSAQFPLPYKRMYLREISVQAFISRAAGPGSLEAQSVGGTLQIRSYAPPAIKLLYSAPASLPAGTTTDFGGAANNSMYFAFGPAEQNPNVLHLNRGRLFTDAGFSYAWLPDAAAAAATYTMQVNDQFGLRLELGFDVFIEG
jgi:hypothetical protein